MDSAGRNSIVTAVAVIALFVGAYFVLHTPEETPVAATGPEDPQPPPPTEIVTPTEVPTPTLPATPTAASPTLASSPTPTVETGPQYVFPVQPPSAARYERGHTAFPATDIYAAVGTEFVAVTSGVVDEVHKRDLWYPGNRDPNERNGIYIAYIGDDGVRYLGTHLSGIASGIRDGQRIEAGQLLGWVGKTGKRKGPAYVHFGISHPTFPGDWEVRRGEVAPYPYLRAWERGRDRAPQL